MSDSLKNRFIYFCSPDSEEDYFARTLIYICENNDEGSFGIILNRSVEIRLKDFFSSANEEIEAKLNKEKIVIGGPVEPMTVYILHNKDSRFDELISINDHISLSTDLNLVKSILEDDGPENFLVSFGYTGWASGQLEREILSGSWLIIPSDKDIIFNTPAVEKINKTSKLAGFDLTTVSSNYGNS
jgi:putative transcriptional regulator